MQQYCRLAGLAALVAAICLPDVSRVGAGPIAKNQQGALDAVAFRSTLRGWLGGAHTVLATTGGGRTWTRQYAGSTTVQQFSFVSDSAGWAMGRGQLLRTTNGGRTWSVAGKPPHALQQIAFVTPSQGWAISGNDPRSRALYRTTDGSRSWTQRSLFMPVGAICFSDPAHGWAARGLSTGKTKVTLQATSDGGATWRSVAVPPGVGGIDGFEGQALSCPAPGTAWDLVTFSGYAGGVGYALYRTADAGGHWQAVAQGMAPGNLGAAAGPGTAPGALAAPSTQTAYLTGTCFACGGQGTTSVGKTLNGGKTWRNNVLPGLPTSSTALSFPTTREGWLVAYWQTGASQQQSAVFQTTDGGATWQRRYPAP